MDKEKLGLIHIYCGDGKGKTTASLGLAIRSAGAGFKVFILQFLKKWNTSELNSLELIPNIEIIRGIVGEIKNDLDKLSEYYKAFYLVN